MRRWVLLAVGLCAMLLLVGCDKTAVQPEQRMTLHYEQDGQSVSDALSQSESRNLAAILDGQTLFDDNPAGEFGRALCVETQEGAFYLAADESRLVQHAASGRFFRLGRSEWEYIQSLLVRHGWQSQAESKPEAWWVQWLGWLT